MWTNHSDVIIKMIYAFSYAFQFYRPVFLQMVLLYLPVFGHKKSLEMKKRHNQKMATLFQPQGIFYKLSIKTTAPSPAEHKTAEKMNVFRNEVIVS